MSNLRLKNTPLKITPKNSSEERLASGLVMGVHALHGTNAKRERKEAMLIVSPIGEHLH